MIGVVAFHSTVLRFRMEISSDVTSLCLLQVFLEQVFFECVKVGIIGISVMLKHENELELVTSDTSFNSISP